MASRKAASSPSAQPASSRSSPRSSNRETCPAPRVRPPTASARSASRWLTVSSSASAQVRPIPTATTHFVNGRPLFRGEGSYSYDAPRREGLIGFDQARLWLPLKAGENDLAVLVSDGFGGWGVMGRFADPRGLLVEPR